MVPSAEIPGIRGSGGIDPASPTSKIGSLTAWNPELARVALGTAVHGKVLGISRDGNVIAQLAGSKYKVRMPGAVEVGDSLKLTLISKQPDIIFLLEGEKFSAEVDLSWLAGNSDSKPESEIVEKDIAPENTFLSLSNGAKKLSNLLTHTPDGTQNPILKGLHPILPTSTTDPHIITQALRETIVHSGLFYESHLTKWAEGLLKLDEILTEPQNIKTSSPIFESTDTLLPIQLTTLEEHFVRWQGELWKGMPIDWQIVERNYDPLKEPTADQEWSSKMKLELPELGVIELLIRLRGNNVLISGISSSPSTADILQKESHSLSEALNRSSISLLSAQFRPVQKDDK